MDCIIESKAFWNVVSLNEKIQKQHDSDVQLQIYASMLLSSTAILKTLDAV